MFTTILMGLAILFMTANLYRFFSRDKYKRSYFQSSLFQKLFFAMLGITIGFGILYYLLSMEGDVVRVGTEEGKDGGETFWDYLYFSGATLLSVGYGDLVPVGKARFFALIQAAIGFLLPTAFFIRALSEKEGQENRSDKRDKNENDNKQADEADG